jgi:hypothetical protein
LGRPLLTTDSLAMRERLGAMSSSTNTLTPRPCSQLPPPRAAAPRAGTRTVSFSDFVLGSTLRVWGGGTEIADGSGPVIRATRDLIAGEVLTMTQEFPGCRSGQYFQIAVQ